jgi:hypothetical protein
MAFRKSKRVRRNLRKKSRRNRNYRGGMKPEVVKNLLIDYLKDAKQNDEYAKEKTPPAREDREAYADYVAERIIKIGKYQNFDDASLITWENPDKLYKSREMVSIRGDVSPEEFKDAYDEVNDDIYMESVMARAGLPGRRPGMEPGRGRRGEEDEMDRSRDRSRDRGRDRSGYGR